jgi:cytochrome c oxidase assembly factor CtaG
LEENIMIGLIACLISISCLVFWISMLAHCLRNQQLEGTEKLIWVLVLIFLNLLGAVLYFALVRDYRFM